MRAATRDASGFGFDVEISIHAAHEGCDKKDIFIRYYAVGISIHAAHEGCDTASHSYSAGAYYISIHAAHAGSDWFKRL